MVDINKLRELKEALKEKLITQEEYEKLKQNVIEESNKSQSNLPSTIEDNVSLISQTHQEFNLRLILGRLLFVLSLIVLNFSLVLQLWRIVLLSILFSACSAIFSKSSLRVKKDKNSNKYLEKKLDLNLDNYLLANESNTAISNKIIEVVKLAIEIYYYSPKKFKKHSKSKIRAYKDNYYSFIFDDSVLIFLSIPERQFQLYRGKCKLLRVKIENDCQISKVYYENVSDEDIVKMHNILNTYKNR